MSDEESFVILGTSPTSSMDTMNSLPMASKPATTTETSNKGGPMNEIYWRYKISDLDLTVSSASKLTTSSSSNGSQFSIVPNGETKNMANGTQEVNDGLQADCVSISAGEMASSVHEDGASSQLPEVSGNSIPSKTDGIAPTLNGMEASMNLNSVKPKNPEATLAASFILGEINSDVLKSTVYSQFPSICSMGACSEEVTKLQKVMAEYLELKKTLINTNITMRQLYVQTQKWKADVKAMEDERRAEIAKLRNENLELRRDLDIKVEQININEEARRKEHEEFIRSLSDKSSQIENMSSQIQKLEQQQLASTNQPKEAIEGGGAVVAEYVTTMEHQRIVKDFERQMSAIVAENLELKDMQQNYIDEINCLKVNLTTAEKLQKKAQEDIDFLKASDVEKSEMFTKFENERKSLRVDLDVLTQQLEIYCRDFKIEQEQRENLANEKDQLLSDLRDLQRKNQELIQEAQKNFEEHAKQTMAATGAFPKTRSQPSSSASSSPKPSIYSPENNFNCPLCGKIFKTLGVLQTHVNQCLDGN